MSEAFAVGVIVGSLRSGSFSRKIAKALIERAPASLQCRFVETGDLPLYNEDLDGQAPEPWRRFREEVGACQAVLFVTPEYNRSIPGCLKNAVDVGSRPQGRSVWDGMPAAVVSVTPYKLGAFGANHALRQTFVFLNMPVMQQPEAYVGGAGELLADDGAVKSEETGKFLKTFMERFAAWISTVRAGGQGPDFQAFMHEREAAAAAYVEGDAGPVNALATAHDPASFFHPRGDRVIGSEAVKARYEADARTFSPGGKSRLEVLQSGSGGGLAFWAGLQHAEAVIDGKTIPMTLRITEVFRLSDGAWKLVHRHADAPDAKG